MRLSKSKYCQGIQCPKILWMHRAMPEEFDDACMNRSALETGDMVGDLAMGYYGDFVEVPYAEDKALMLDETRRLIEEGTPVIAEASFAFEGNFCSVDILLDEGDGVRIVEVKSSTKPKPIYLHDMAYQCYMVSSCGFKVKSVSLMHLNSQYARQGDLDLQQLFIVEDHTDDVLAMQQDIPAAIERIRAVAAQEEEPQMDIGVQCANPYPCGFKKHCWAHLPERSVFDLPKAHMTTKVARYLEGVVTFRDLIDANVELKGLQAPMVACEELGADCIFDFEQVEAFLDTLSMPLYFLDFETFQQAIPQWDGVRPYQQIPFQYSLHIKEDADAALQHREFLAKEGEDPRRALAERLCEDVPADVCVVAYNISFEKTRIKELAELFPDLAEHLLSLADNLRDLMVPFGSGACYLRDMKGSCSIKAVLPAMCPDDPELDYHNLEGISNGGEAMCAYETLHLQAPEDIERIRRQLLAYCRLDTLAMVKVLEKLFDMYAARKLEREIGE